jgi:DNA-binding response OmpR family regulator
MNSFPELRRLGRPDIRTALESAGFFVFDASEGGRDLERIRDLWAAFLLLGLPMPRMAGVEIFHGPSCNGEPDAIVLMQGRIPDAVLAVKLANSNALVRLLTPRSLRGAVEEVIRHAGGFRSGADLPRILVAVDSLAFSLLRAKRALDLRRFDEAGRLLRGVLDVDPDSTSARKLISMLPHRIDP